MSHGRSTWPARSLPSPLQSLKSSCLPPDGSNPPSLSFSTHALTQGQTCRLTNTSPGLGQGLLSSSKDSLKEGEEVISAIPPSPHLMPTKPGILSSCIFKKNTRRNLKIIHICACLKLKVTALKNSGPTPISAGYPVGALAPGEGGGGKLCQPRRSRVSLSWKAGISEPPFSHQGERKMNEGGGRFFKNTHTYRCAESRAMQHHGGRGEHARVSPEEERWQRRAKGKDLPRISD